MARFWIDVRGSFVHIDCYQGGGVTFCSCSEPVGQCPCGHSLRDCLEYQSGPNSVPRAVWCKREGYRYPFVTGPDCSAGSS